MIEGLTIDAGEGRRLLILGGMHGDEPKSMFVARRLVQELTGGAGQQSGGRWLVLPCVNPDGSSKRRRRNAAGVDINRNFPTKNWQISSPRSRMFGGHKPASEPETRAVIRAIDRFGPDVVITIHSISSRRFCVNYDGPGRSVAAMMARRNGYPLRASIGYPTPGSFGTWAGMERGIPTITLELPSHHSMQACWRENREALLALGRVKSHGVPQARS